MRKSQNSAQNNSSALCVYDPRQNGGYFGSKPPLFSLPSSEYYAAKRDADVQTDIPILHQIGNYNAHKSNYEHHEEDIPHNNRQFNDNKKLIEEPEDLPTADSDTSPRDPLDVQPYNHKLEGFMKGRILLRDILHPDHTSSILKLFFNGIIGTVICLLIVLIFLTIREDLTKKRAQEMEAVVLEISQCTKDFYDNRCEPERRRPALEEYCLEKEKCMTQDPMKVIHTFKLTAALVAEILNEFVQPLEFKTMAFFFIILFGVILVFNCSLRGSSNRIAPSYERVEEYNEVKERLRRIERLSLQHFSDKKYK